MSNRPCPKVVGIDEHFFTRKRGFATTLVDLRRNKVFDVRLGRSESSLEGYLRRLRGKGQCSAYCHGTCPETLPQDRAAALSSGDDCPPIASTSFGWSTNIFLSAWKDVDPEGRRHRGLLSLMRRHAWRLRPEQHKKLTAAI